MCACVGWYVRLPKALSPLSPSVSVSSFLSQLVSLLVSLYGGRSHFTFFPGEYTGNQGFLMLSHVFDPVPQNMS